jgi:SPP1 family predicted phage head-tail adaptor
MLQSSIRRGQMDRQGIFIKKSLAETSDSNEDKVAAWVKVDYDHTVWLIKRDLKGSDSILADRPTYNQRTLFIGDYRTDITSENRLVVDGRVYDIIAVTDNNESRGRYTDFMCNLIDNETWSA